MLRISSNRGRCIRIFFDIPPWLESFLVLPVLWYRRIRYGYAFRRIPLSQGKYAIVDPEDYDRLNKYKWWATKHGRSCYAIRCVSIGNGRQKNIQMHRDIIKVEDGKFPDHINHNGLDNRKANLRQATRAQNCWNKRKQIGKHSSKYKGVSWFKTGNKWGTRIQVNGRKIFLGCYKKEIDAAKAYDIAAKKYHGDFAGLNFPNN